MRSMVDTRAGRVCELTRSERERCIYITARLRDIPYIARANWALVNMHAGTKDRTQMWTAISASLRYGLTGITYSTYAQIITGANY